MRTIGALLACLLLGPIVLGQDRNTGSEVQVRQDNDRTKGTHHIVAAALFLVRTPAVSRKLTTKLPRRPTSPQGTNTGMMSGKSNAIALAKAGTPTIDVPQPGQQPPRIGPPELETYPVLGGNAEAIAKNLQEIYKGTSSLRIAAVGNSSILVYAGPDEQFKIAKFIGGKEQRAPEKSLQKRPRPHSSLVRDGAEPSLFVSQLSDPHQAKMAPKQAPDALPGRPDLPVTITPFGNKLIVTSDDPQALALVNELVRLLTQTEAGEGDFQVLRLKNANAVQAAQELDEMFNGPKEKSPQNTNRFTFGGRGGRGGAAVTVMSEPRKERIRVVADPETNLLLVKASPIDLLTIRSLLRKAIDTVDSDSRAVMRTWTIGLKHASAAEVSRVIRDVYRESINTNSVLTTVGGIRGVGFFGTRARGPGTIQNVASSGPTGAALSIAVDDQTNTLVLHCAESLYDDINKLVAQLEKAAADSNRTVKVISLKGVDPQLVQQAIDVMQGRRTTSGSRSGTGSFRSSTRPGF